MEKDIGKDGIGKKGVGKEYTGKGSTVWSDTIQEWIRKGYFYSNNPNGPLYMAERIGLVMMAQESMPNEEVESLMVLDNEELTKELARKYDLPERDVSTYAYRLFVSRRKKFIENRERVADSYIS